MEPDDEGTIEILGAVGQDGDFYELKESDIKTAKGFLFESLGKYF